jgi:hypothetical protein
MTEHMALWLAENTYDLVVVVSAIVVAFLIVVSVLTAFLKGMS